MGTKYIREILKILTSEKIDLLHLNTLTPFCKYAGLAGYLRKLPIVWIVRENPLISRSRRLRFWLEAIATKIIFVDSDTKEKLLRGKNYDADVIHNGVDVELFKPFKSSFLFEKFDINGGTKLIGYIGMITERKGLEYLIKSLPLIKEHSDNFKLILIGGYKSNDENYFLEIKNLIKELSLEEDIYFTGLLPDVIEALNSLDIVVLPSLEERCSRSLLESLSCAKAVVATRVGGNPEIVEDGINGFLVEPKNERQIAEAILRLLEDGELRRRMGIEGRLKAEKIFNMKNHMIKMTTLYHEVSGR